MNEPDTVTRSFDYHRPQVDRRQFLSNMVGGAAAGWLSAGWTLNAAAADTIAGESAELVEKIFLPEKAAAIQGVVTTEKHFFATHNRAGVGLVHRYDTKWKFIETAELRVKGVDHIGAFSHHGGSLWAGWLSTKKPSRGIVTEIRTSDLTVARQFDISDDVTWIDPVCYDGKHVWVGDLSDLGIHRYQIKGDKFVRNALFRYPKEMHFSQGLQIRDDRLYSIHTFGKMDGLFEFHIPSLKTDGVNQPTRSWPIAESTMHLEGFDFVPGTKNEIWHAQGTQVDRWRLENLD